MQQKLHASCRVSRGRSTPTVGTGPATPRRGRYVLRILFRFGRAQTMQPCKVHCWHALPTYYSGTCRLLLVACQLTLADPAALQSNSRPACVTSAKSESPSARLAAWAISGEGLAAKQLNLRAPHPPCRSEFSSGMCAFGFFCRPCLYGHVSHVSVSEACVC